MPETPPVPRGLVLFHRDAPAAFRRRRLAAVVVVVAAFLALSWPIYSLFAAAAPRVLGLPLSLAWVVGWLVAVFAALLWLFAGEGQETPSAQEPG